MNQTAHDPIWKRYENDPEFKNLVQHLYAFMTQMRFTPTEIREALFLAQFKYTSENPHPYTSEDLKNSAQSVIHQGISKRIFNE